MFIICQVKFFKALVHLTPTITPWSQFCYYSIFRWQNRSTEKLSNVVEVLTWEIGEQSLPLSRFPRVTWMLYSAPWFISLNGLRSTEARNQPSCSQWADHSVCLTACPHTWSKYLCKLVPTSRSWWSINTLHTHTHTYISLGYRFIDGHILAFYSNSTWVKGKGATSNN